MNTLKQKMALISGMDIVAHRETVHAIRSMINHDYKPVMNYAHAYQYQNPNAHQQMFKDFSYVESKILWEVVFPYLDANPHIKSPFPTPKTMAARYGLDRPKFVKNVNDPAFYQPIGFDPNLLMTLSLRCTQKFNEAATNAFKANGRHFVNAHTGLLPETRGLIATGRDIYDFKAGLNNKGVVGATIHHIEAHTPSKDNPTAGIDTGNIIDLDDVRIDPTMSVYSHNILISDKVGGMVEKMVERVSQGSTLRGYPQDNSKGRYFSFPTPEETQQWKDAGVVMWDVEGVVSDMTKTFISDQRYARDFENMVREAIYKAIPQNDSNPPLVPTKTGNERRAGERRVSTRGSFGQAVVPTAETRPTPTRAGPRGTSRNGRSTTLSVGS